MSVYASPAVNSTPFLPCLLAAVAIFSCSSGTPAPDAGVPDAAAVVSCDSPEDCRLAGVVGVCRQNECKQNAWCADDVECGLGERCLFGTCAFTGCLSDEECATGRCRLESFACAECGQNSDCPADRPVCEPASGQCVQCQLDSDCSPFGPSYCQATSGRCVHCKLDDHCPNGMVCDADGACAGAQEGQSCPDGVRCDVGLMCITFQNGNQCMRPCGLYEPECPSGKLCFKLTFLDSNALVFESGAPLGVCVAPVSGLRSYREACTRSSTGHNCQGNLDCVPDSATSAVCRSFCDPVASNCASGELCHPFPGDYDGREYGLCYPDNGFGVRCSSDADCSSGLGCGVLDDPSSWAEIGNFCRFSTGTAPALAPCANVTGTDGGLLPPNSVCRSGSCQGELALGAASYYCYGACQSDLDCQADGVRGTCDGTFEFAGTNVTGSISGCRPGCDNPEQCLQYGANFTCRTQLKVASYTSTLKQVCGATSGSAGLGESCLYDGECRSGYCALEDGRGVQRKGVCLHPCQSTTDCQSTGGTSDGGSSVGIASGTIGCESIAVLGFKGYDGVANTYDDRFHVTQQCSGAACATDLDCGGAGLCVPVPDHASPLSNLTLRCRPPHRTGTTLGGAACATDADCQSGACVDLQAPSVGSGRVCFQACDGATTCPGTTNCRTDGAYLRSANGTPKVLTTCAP